MSKDRLPPAQTVGDFRLEWLDFHRATAQDRAEINHVFATTFDADIGITFNAALDKDCTSPLTYYDPDANRGAFLVVRHVAARNAATGRAPVVGTAGLRHLPELGNTCELKRMFLLEACRGKKVGMPVVNMILACAAAFGYDFVVLDTKKKLKAANSLYERAGFVDCENYNGNPRADRFMRRPVCRAHL